MKNFMVAFRLVTALILSGGAAWAQEKPNWAPYPDLTGVWTGKSYFMLEGGKTEQFQRFEFTEQDGPFLRGTHAWEIIGKNLHSHDGTEHTYEATEAMLGVIAQDGTIHLVEHGDDTRFVMRLLNNHTLDFIATEGGEHILVGHGVLMRE